VTSVPLDRSTLQLAPHLTPATYYRLLLPDILPASLRRAIYLDCDVIVGRDLAELWTIDLLGKPIAAVADVNFRDWSKLGIDPNEGYFNAGVLLLDLELIRAQASFAAALAFSQEHPSALTWSDQCALNKIFAGNWQMVAKHWNYQHSAFLEDIRILGMAKARSLAVNAVLHFNNYERPWLVDSRHPLRTHYTTILRAHPELDPSEPMQLKHYWKMLKRTVKWKSIEWQGNRSRSSRPRAD
jgi:lipopolysaccharide biosynthesis glycosyltransferase